MTSAAPKALLTMARFSAGALFPSITFCFLSKCYASRYFLHNSWIALIVDFEPTHKLHTCETGRLGVGEGVAFGLWFGV